MSEIPYFKDKSEMTYFKNPQDMSYFKDPLEMSYFKEPSQMLFELPERVEMIHSVRSVKPNRLQRI